MTKKLICKLLLEQLNSAFSIPLSNKVVTDPVSFFAISNACYKRSEVLLTSINFSEQMIIDAISEISASSAPGNLVGNGSDVQVVLCIQEIIFKSSVSVTGSK